MSRVRYERAGRRAEYLAAWSLRLKGYRILHRRYKSPSGEIDLIARKKNVLVIVEVKQRESRSEAEDSLSDYALGRISRATDDFIARTPHVQNLAVRFDVIFVIGTVKLIHLKDAWRDT